MAVRIPALTGVRTIAAGSVCLTHAAFWTGHYTDDFSGRLFARFEVGVAIFFVLSGFLLFGPWVRALADGLDDPSIGRYLWHRARRILPAYWIVVVAVYALYLSYTPPDADPDLGSGWSGFLRTMTLTQVYGLGHLHAGLTQIWSLAAEVVFYLVLPPIAWMVTVVVCRRRWRPDLVLIALGALMTVSPIWSVVVAGSVGISPSARLWAPAFFGWFVAGMILAVCVRLIRRWPATPSVAIAVVAFVLSGTAVPLTTAYFVMPEAAAPPASEDVNVTATERTVDVSGVTSKLLTVGAVRSRKVFTWARAETWVLVRAQT